MQPGKAVDLASFWLFLLDYAAVFACSRQSKVVPLSHIRCMMTASLRATATRARLPPARLATLTAQAFNADHRVHPRQQRVGGLVQGGPDHRIAALC